jgi:hypothetical protein
MGMTGRGDACRITGCLAGSTSDVEDTITRTDLVSIP